MRQPAWKGTAQPQWILHRWHHVAAVPTKAKPRRITETRPPERPRWYASKYVRFGALAIVAAAAAVAISVAVGSRSGSPPAATNSGTVKSIGPIVLSASRLKGVVDVLGVA